MEQTHFKCFFVILLLILATIVTVQVDGAGECGQAPIANVAIQMAPCASASQSVSSPVSSRCCAAVAKIGQNPKCLCAVMLSSTAKAAGVKPAVAITIPKRCNLKNRPVGYKCGPYTLP